MSMSDVTQASCPHCGFAQRFSIFGSVTASKDLDLKRQVLDGTIFNKSCSKCRKAFRLNQSFLYNDPNANLAIWLCEGGVTDELQDAMDSFGMVLSKENRLRIVYNLEELIEKIKIFETGLNDWYVHTIKMALAEGSEFTTDQIRFLKVQNDGGGEFTFTFNFFNRLGQSRLTPIPGIENVRTFSSKWDALETQFDWLYVGDNNFYKVYSQFKNYLE